MGGDGERGVGADGEEASETILDIGKSLSVARKHKKAGFGDLRSMLMIFSDGREAMCEE